MTVHAKLTNYFFTRKSWLDKVISRFLTLDRNEIMIELKVTEP